jgi:hypothetical protein
MLWRAWIASLVVTVVQVVLGVIGAAQTGECFPGDPIAHCPDAHGLAGIGYLLFVPTIATAFIALVLTAVVAWRFAMRLPIRHSSRSAVRGPRDER